MEQADFFSPNGLAEHYLAMTARPGGNFQRQAEELLERLTAAAAGKRFLQLRFHLSDVVNQAPLLRELCRSFDVPLSLVGQPPVNSAKLALDAWLVSPSPAIGVREGCLRAELKNYRLLLFQRETLAAHGSGPQTDEEFRHAEQLLAAEGGSVEANLQRTWIYCRDIDNNYAGLVAARRELFHQYGLTQNTHYIASTGIEGMCDPFDRLVRMDSLALFGHRPEQIEYLTAPEHLSPTHVYGVTFERGTRIVYGDRSAYYISGTASIDKEGKIVHPGDVARQTERMLENVEALLNSRQGQLADLKQAVVYLRDPADHDEVETILTRRLPANCARIMVRGAVCRPGWLVELDGVAVNSTSHPSFAPFA